VFALNSLCDEEQHRANDGHRQQEDQRLCKWQAESDDYPKGDAAVAGLLAIAGEVLGPP
jgi:hypothetical protein